MTKLRRQSILTSYLIGTPIGLFTILIVFSLPAILTGEGLATMAIIEAYRNAIIGLVLSFLIALGYGGDNAYKDLQKQGSLLAVSFKYSLTVNLIIWAVFVAITAVDNFNKDVWLVIVPPIIAFIISVVATTFTIGLLICYIIRNKVKRHANN